MRFLKTGFPAVQSDVMGRAFALLGLVDPRKPYHSLVQLNSNTCERKFGMFFLALILLVLITQAHQVEFICTFRFGALPIWCLYRCEIANNAKKYLSAFMCHSRMLKHGIIENDF